MPRIKPHLALVGLALGAWGVLETPAVRAASGLSAAPSAHVSEDLRRSEAYTLYAKTLVQIDLLANPRTAHLPVSVAAIRPGSLIIEGTVPQARIREYILANAQRITGLSIEGHLETGELPEAPIDGLPARELEADIQATITGFYPEHAGNVRVTVTDNGMVELHGEVNSYDAKLNISRIVNSQQGCRAVINLLRVPADPDRGIVFVTEDGSLSLEANRLPIIPAAPIVDLDPAGENHPSIRNAGGALADDAPATATTTLRLIEEARSGLSRDPELGLLDLQVDAEDGGIVVSGKVDSREKVENLIDRLSDVPDISKVLVKSRPYSMQRTFAPTSAGETKKETSWSDSMKSWIPGMSGSDPISQARTWRYRDSVRRSLNRMCGKRLDDLSVLPSTRGLIIEGTATSARDRAFILKQVDNLPELRNVPTDIVLKIEGN